MDRIICYWYATVSTPHHPNAPCWVSGIVDVSGNRSFLLSCGEHNSKQEAEEYAEATARRLGLMAGANATAAYPCSPQEWDESMHNPEQLFRRLAEE